MRPGKQHGFTLIALMAALVLLALATEGVVSVLSEQKQREREAELLTVGGEFVRALGSYYNASPGSVKTFPKDLSDLVEDSRFLVTKRHIRRLYDDPVAQAPLGLIRREDGTIEGVRSTSDQEPIQATTLDVAGIRLAAATRYSEWRFVYAPPAEGRK